MGVTSLDNFLSGWYAIILVVTTIKFGRNLKESNFFFQDLKYFSCLRLYMDETSPDNSLSGWYASIIYIYNSSNMFRLYFAAKIIIRQIIIFYTQNFNFGSSIKYLYDNLIEY
jgi:hypothetical protein